MQENKTYFKQAKLLLVVILGMVAPSWANANESLQNGLQRCGLMDNASARLACYDQLGGRQNKDNANVIEPTVLPKKELNSRKFSPQNVQQTETETETETVIVKVTKCRKSGGNNKYTFYLEDGQVWKQVSSKRLNFKDCNFGVSIHKDFFGYKMQLENSEKKFSVSRIR